MEQKVVVEHVQKHAIVEYLHMPEHDQRKETNVFKNSKHELEKVDHHGCFKCGTMDKRESHHIFERCWANGFNYRLVAYFLFHHYDFHGYCHRDFKSDKDLLDFFIEHYNGKVYTVKDEFGRDVEIVECDEDALDTIYNQLILCETHHRGEGTGIHYESTPTFMAMQATRPDFKNALTKQEYEKFVQEHHEK